MPTYDYQCRSCGVITEVVHSMLVDGPTQCERCGGELRPIVHPTGIIFKGSGFYKTDSRPAQVPAASAAAGDGQKTPATTANDAGSKPAKDAASSSPPAPTSTPKPTPPKAASTAD